MKAWSAASIEDLRRIARLRLPRAVFDFIDGAADDEVTLRWNCADFDRIAWRPRVLIDVSKRDCGATILGRAASLPLTTARARGRIR